MRESRLIRCGIVSSVNPEAGTARVAFEDRGVVSYELSVLQRGTLGVRDYWMPTPGEQVWCLYSPNGDIDGLVLGSVYSDEDPPPVTSAAKRRLEFPDGTYIEYDHEEHLLKLVLKGSVKTRLTQPIRLEINAPIKVIATEEFKMVLPKGLTIDGSITLSGGVNTNEPMPPEPPEEWS